MNVKELENIASAEGIRVFVDYGVYEEFSVSVDDNYTNLKNEPLWSKYGECEVNQIYAGYDNYLNIDLK